MDKNQIKKNLFALKSTYPDAYNHCQIMLGKMSADKSSSHTYIFDAINSLDINEKQAGIFLLVLIADDTNLDEDSSRIFQFSKNLLKTLTANNCNEPIIRLATKAIAYLILTSKSNAIELMEVALNQCFEWLEEPQRNEQKRLAAVILAKDLALYTQSHFFQRANQFFNNIFKILREAKPQLRQAAAEGLRAALAVTAQREAKHKSEWYNKCVKEACSVDFPNLLRDDVLHGSLLIFNELLRIANYKHENLRLEFSTNIQSNNSRVMMGQNPIEWLIEPFQQTATVESRTSRTIVTDYFQEIVKKCLEARNCKAPFCQNLILEIFPRLASFVDTNYSMPFCNVIEAAEHSLAIVNKYPEAIVTFGFLALSRPIEIRPKLQQILGIIVQHTQMAISKKRLMQPNDFKCISLIVRSQRTFLKDNIKELLPLLFSTGISPGLINVMHTIIEEIPELKDTVFDHFMDQLYQLLMDRPRPSKLAPPTAALLPTGPIMPANIPQTILALKTLGEFDFSRHSLQMFLRYVAMGYLTSESIEIRLTAVNSCAEMIKPFIKIYDQVENRQKAELYSLIRNVLECLVKTAIVDTDFNVRLKVMKCFCNVERDLLIHLAENDILEMILMTLQDENFQVREKTVELLGRLTDFNPAFIFLKFRRVLLESISQLVNSRTPNIEEHGARMIENLARQSPRFMSPYLYSTIIALIPHLKIDRSNTAVSIAVLDAINELALIGGIEFLQSIDKIFPSLIAFLQDVTSLNRREAALRAMGRICQSTGYVVQPYKDYSNLLEVLLNLLKTELSNPMRRLTMKVLGIIGALDPYTWRVWIGKIQSSSKSRSLALTLPNSGESIETHGIDIINWINYEKLNLKEYYQALAITNLLKMLQEPQRATIIHTEIVQSLYQIFTNLNNRNQYVGKVIPQLIITAQNCRPDLRETYLNQISKFVSLIRLQLQPYMAHFFGFISKAWYWSEDPHLRSKIIQLVEDVGSSFGENFATYVTDLCPYLLNVLQNDKSAERKLTLQALSCTRTIVNCLGTHIHIIISPILLVIEDKDAPDETRIAALDTIIELAARHPIMDKAPMIMQTWLRCISVKSLQKKLMALLLIIIQKWDQFLIFKDGVNSAMKRARVDQILRQEYREQLNNIQAGIVATNNENILPRNQAVVSPTFPHQIQLLPMLPQSEEQSTSSQAYSNQLDMDSKIARQQSAARDMRHQINFDLLRRFLSTNMQNSREEWLQWLSTLRIQFIRQSPSSSIRACTSLSDKNATLANELFNAAFVSIWTEVREPEQNELVIQLIEVLRNCPHAEPIQAILNLAEFMDHSEKGPLPIDYNVLSKAAESTRANSKALRYKELDIITTKKGEPTAEDCQYLIILYKKLNLEEGAVGVVRYAQRNNMEISGRWYEKLGEWEKAMEMYRQEMLAMPDTDSWQTLSSASSFTTPTAGQSGHQQQEGGEGLPPVESSTTVHSLSIQGEPSLKSQKSHHTLNNNSKGTAKFDIVLHQMRCLEALGQWKQLNNACQTTLIENEADIHMEAQHQHHQSGNQSSRNLEMANEFLNTTLSAIARRQKIAQMAARANWALGDYEKMEEYIQMINENTQEGSFMRAVMAIRNNEFGMAQDYINKVRDIFDSELTAMATESYDRAYGAMVLLQELTELEEAIEYKMLPEREIRIALLWSRRLQGCRPNIEHWRRILMVRSIVFEQKELRPLWIKFASLCRREGKQLIARNVLRSLLEIPPEIPFENIQIPFDKPQLALAVCKQMWTDGHKMIAISLLEQLTQTLHRLIERNRLILAREHLEPMAKITAKCYLKLGEWHESLYQPIVVPMILDRRGSLSSPLPLTSMAAATSATFSNTQQQQFWNIPYPQRSPLPTGYGGGGGQAHQQQYEQPSTKKLHYYLVASSFDQNWYKAWHRLATTYYNLVMSERQFQQTTIPQSASAALLSGVTETGGPSATQHSATMAGAYCTSLSQAIPPISPVQQSPIRSHQLITNYAVNAVRCLFKAIQLAEGSRLNDTLRLLMLWFDFGDRPEVFEQLRDSLKLIPPEVWLEVVPQLIARLDSQQNTGILVKQLVIDVTKAYPQAWVYALTAATKSRNSLRSKVAKEILEILAENKPTLVEQAMLVNDELIRCAILWHEQWHEALEEASRFYFQDKNVDEMINVLRPLHQRIEAGHTTMKEQSFNQTYYKDLKDALEHCEAFRRTGNQKEMTAAWDLYYNVFKRISNQLRQMSTLDLNYISPRLSKIRNLEVSIPGTYDPTNPLITISMIHPHLQVIMSKQRPRKIYMRGSDGKEYAFLLKGHEDPRQDERVMQLFGLINSLILRQPETCRQNLAIQRYSITTLSQSSGLIGWVPNCDTLHALIKDYREKRKIPISEEHNKMQSLCIDIDKCTLLQKVEVFEEAMRSTAGDDLRQTLWMKSPNSEVWFDRRTNYTRSMSVMSMVGYILGLGDRHPSNLMLDRISGKIVHIDFGDCFEVAMKREKYPEKIPFRLTRMLIQAMEVTGIDGNFRLTCERVLRLLRSNNDSILAVLESFVYDPVLNWRFGEGGGKGARPMIPPTNGAEMGGTDGGAIAHRNWPNPQQDLINRRGGPGGSKLLMMRDPNAAKMLMGETGAMGGGGGGKRGDNEAINRVKSKLCGRDFNPYVEIPVSEQVDRLIEQATLPDNLCQCYIGWCPFW